MTGGNRRRLMVSSRLTVGVPGRTLDSMTPAVGAVVMGTAIVSIALSLDGQETLSRLILAIAALIWVTVAVLLPFRAVRDPAAFRADAHTPAALTAAVATAVLGTRLTALGWAWAGIAMLVIAFVLWVALLGPVLEGWKSPTVGASLLLAVSAESLAVLAATLAAREHASWLLIAALVPFGVGLGLYLFVISRFDFHQLAVGRGDHWITGGALGIAALAAARIADGASLLGILGGGGALEDVAIALWVLTMLWLLVLLVVEVRWPRFGYDPRRWSTVFPLGMYAACSFAVGAVAHAGAVTSFARAWVWIGLASWAIVIVATIRRAVEVMPGQGPPDAGTPAFTAEEPPPHPRSSGTTSVTQPKPGETGAVIFRSLTPTHHRR
jgi:tellurite resistance protein TehA-like permease